MTTDPKIMRAVESLDYRVTVGDVASQAGIDVRYAEQGVLALASEVGGTLQVAESGEVAYVFPNNFRDILRSKYFRLRLQEWWAKIWGVLFYLIRITFGILLLLSIVLIVLAIIIILVALSSSRGDDQGDNSGDYGGGGGGVVYMPTFWIGPDWYWIFLPDYGDRPSRRSRASRRGAADREMNFLEAIYSFLFGDGNPNADLEERRWQAIATVIRNNDGAVVAEQIAPYLDEVGQGYSQEYEEYMIPVLSRFNGRPEVSDEGQLVYHFPELQVTAEDRRPAPVAAYLKEFPWQFSKASTGQLVGALSLGMFNFVGAIVLGLLLRRPDVQEIVAELGGVTGFVAAIYGVLLAYGTGFLSIPLIRYLTLNVRNKSVETRNDRRMLRAELLNNADQLVQHKLDFARQFAATQVVREEDLAYRSDRDLTEQELERKDQIDAEWQQRLEQSETS